MLPFVPVELEPDGAGVGIGCAHGFLLDAMVPDLGGLLMRPLCPRRWFPLSVRTNT